MRRSALFPIIAALLLSSAAAPAALARPHPSRHLHGIGGPPSPQISTSPVVDSPATLGSSPAPVTIYSQLTTVVNPAVLLPPSPSASSGLFSAASPSPDATPLPQPRQRIYLPPAPPPPAATYPPLSPALAAQQSPPSQGFAPLSGSPSPLSHKPCSPCDPPFPLPAAPSLTPPSLPPPSPPPPSPPPPSPSPPSPPPPSPPSPPPPSPPPPCPPPPSPPPPSPPPPSPPPPASPTNPSPSSLYRPPSPPHPPPLIQPKPSPTALPTVPIGATTSGSPFALSAAQIQAVLDVHNNYRAIYTAVPLVWRADLASDAASWASNCVFMHSGFAWGENIAAGTGGRDAAGLAALWYTQEVCNYNYANPYFAENTGHFTQMVWASTTSIGCAWADPSTCPNGILNPMNPSQSLSYMLVCEYDPPGNGGGFAQNVHVPTVPPTCN